MLQVSSVVYYLYWGMPHAPSVFSGILSVVENATCSKCLQWYIICIGECHMLQVGHHEIIIHRC